jgi:hypothetical protein
MHINTLEEHAAMTLGSKLNATGGATPYHAWGYVIDNTGQPVSYPRIDVKAPDGSVYGSQYTGDNGGAWQMDLPSSDYVLVVSANGYATSAANKASVISNGYKLALVKNSTSYHAWGFVVDADTGKPVPYPVFQMFLPDGVTPYRLGHAASVTGDQSGAWNADLPSGDYVLVIQMEGYPVYKNKASTISNGYKLAMKSNVVAPVVTPTPVATPVPAPVQQTTPVVQPGLNIPAATPIPVSLNTNSENSPPSQLTGSASAIPIPLKTADTTPVTTDAPASTVMAPADTPYPMGGGSDGGGTSDATATPTATLPGLNHKHLFLIVLACTLTAGLLFFNPSTNISGGKP